MNFAEIERLLQEGSYRDALAALLPLRERFGESSERGQDAICALLIGQALLGLSRPLEAIDSFASARTMFRNLGFDQVVAVCDGNIGNALRDLARWQEAVECYTSARETFRRLGMQAEESATTMNIGVSLRDMGKAHEALKYFKEALVSFSRIGPERTLAMCLENIGTALRDFGSHEEACEHLNRALGLYQKLGMHRDAADCEDEIGVTLAAMGRPADSLAHFRAAHAIYERLELPKKLADARVNEGNAMKAMGRPETALRAFADAIEVYERHDLPKAAADCKINMGAVLQALNRAAEAMNCFKEALETYKTLDSPKFIAVAQANVGSCLHALGRYEESLEVCRSARGLYLDLELAKDAAGCDLNIGHSCATLGRMDQALEAYSSAHLTYETLGLDVDLAHCEVLISGVFLVAGQPHDAYLQLETARNRYNKLQLPREAAHCDAQIAATLMELKRLPAAVERFQAAKSSLTSLGLDADAARCDANLGLCAYDENKFDTAFAHYSAALTVFERLNMRREAADTKVNLGITYRDAKQPVKAREHHEAAREIYVALGLEREIAACDVNVAVTLVDTGDWSAALERSERAMGVFESIRSQIATTQLRRGFGERHRGSYHVATFCCLTLGRFGEALEYLERSRAKTLAEAVSGLVTIEPGEISPELYEKYCALRQPAMEFTQPGDSRPSGLDPSSRPRRYHEEYKRVLAEIVARHPSSAAAQKIRSVDVTWLHEWRDYVGLMPDPRSCVVDCMTWADDDRLRVLLITSQNGLELVEFPNGSLSRLMALSRQWTRIYGRELEGDRIAQVVKETCVELQAAFIEAHIKVTSDRGAASWRGRFIDYLDKTLDPGSEEEPRSICFIPHRFLFLLPLHAAARVENGRLRYLMEDYVISYAPSAYLLHMSKRDKQRPQTEGRALIVANPTPSDRPLAGAVEEGRRVKGALRKCGWHVDELCEGRATKTGFLHGCEATPGIRSGRYSHLHLAQHATVDQRGRSGLVFGRASVNSLTADYVCMESDIVFGGVAGVKSVVAATCISALTDPTLDEYQGLAAAFLQSGVRTFIGTLYQLSDVGSQYLVPELYRLRFEGGLSWAAALRKAQLHMSRGLLTQGSGGTALAIPEDGSVPPNTDILPKVAETVPLDHPYHWASFALTGQP